MTSAIDRHTRLAGTCAPTARTMSLNRRRSSPRWIASKSAPINSTPYLSSTPRSCSATAMFNAVWQSGELAVIDPATRAIKSHLPTIEDAARFYQAKAGVPIDKFLAAAKSFSVDVKVRAAEGLTQAYRVDRTPTIIVNGKYRLHTESAGGNEELVELVKWLVVKESK